MVLYISILKGCKDFVKKLVGIYISDIHLQVFTGIHEIYTPAIEQSDWSECTSLGTNIFHVHLL